MDSLISWNVNGFRAVMRKNFLEFIKTYDPDILCLQETKCEEQPLPLELSQYYAFWNPATDRKGYSGTAIFSKKKPASILYNTIPLLQGEGRVITAEYETYYVVNVYTPNSKEDLSRLPLRHTQWDPQFLAHVKSLERRKPVITCGDFNVAHTERDLARPKQNVGHHGFTSEEREGMDAYIASGLVDTFRLFETEGGHYTWWAAWGGARQRNVGWRIDYVLASNALTPAITSADILSQVYGSDHCPVRLTFSPEV